MRHGRGAHHLIAGKPRDLVVLALPIRRGPALARTPIDRFLDRLLLLSAVTVRCLGSFGGRMQMKRPVAVLRSTAAGRLRFCDPQPGADLRARPESGDDDVADFFGRAAVFGFGYEVQPAGSVRREGEGVDPSTIDRWLTAAVVFEDEGAARVEPDCNASATEAPIFPPAETESFASAEFCGNDELQVGESAVFDLGSDVTLVDEFAHRCILYSPRIHRGRNRPVDVWMPIF